MSYIEGLFGRDRQNFGGLRQGGARLAGDLFLGLLIIRVKFSIFGKKINVLVNRISGLRLWVHEESDNRPEHDRLFEASSFFLGVFDMKKLFAMTLLALATLAQAESTAAKKELVAKILQLQQPAIEMSARALAERPALQMMQQAGMALQSRVAPEKRDAIAKEIQAEVKKYVDETGPLMRERAVKLAPSTVGVLLEERFSEEELKQLIVLIESPVNQKFMQMGGEMQKALMDKLVADMQGTIEPKVKTLEKSIIKSLGLPTASAAASNTPAKASTKASGK